MRVIVPPVVVGDRICRIVAAVESLLEVEEWVGQWWEPSTVTLSDASLGVSATEAVLESRGVPTDDWRVATPRLADMEIQALLQTRDPHVAEPMRLDDAVTRSSPPRRRSYPGNARFSSRTIAAMERAQEVPDRRRRSDGNRNGPRRRKTDTPTDGDGAR
jgi:hypothetical protein